MKTGIFGGTFNPIHFGHLILAERAREGLALDSVLFMPAHLAPHKQGGRPLATGSARLDMIRLACESNAAFELTPLEIEREGVSYTIDSLEELHTARPDDEFVLLIGSDNAATFSSWKDPERILELAELAIWDRPGNYYWPEVYPDYLATRITAPLIEISSTEIRNRIKEGASIRYLTPESVIEYIADHELYR